jgi:hypothetical protein
LKRSLTNIANPETPWEQIRETVKSLGAVQPSDSAVTRVHQTLNKEGAKRRTA